MAKVIKSDLAPAPVGPYSQAVLAMPSEKLFTAGQVPLDPATGALVEGGITEQTKCVLDNLRRILEAGGFSFRDVVKTTVYMTDLSEFASMNEVYAEYFTDPFPARTTVQVGALPKGALVEIDLIAAK